MGLIVDNSGSMRTKRGRVEASAMALVKASNPQDEVFIVNFNDEAFLDQPFTNDIKELERGLSKIDSRGGTAMRDAIRMSIDYLKENGKKDKKVLVVVTDGDDNNSSGTLENLVKASQQSEVLIYTVGVLAEEEKREAKRATRALNAIAEATGGKSYYPKELKEVEAICQQVARDIRSQYIIQYSPKNSTLDGSFRQIKVVANGPNHPVVRTRSGYYATPINPSDPPVRRENDPPAVAALARIQAPARGEVPICAGAWKPIGDCTRNASASRNSGFFYGGIGGIWCVMRAGLRAELM